MLVSNNRLCDDIFKPRDLRQVDVIKNKFARIASKLRSGHALAWISIQNYVKALFDRLFATNGRYSGMWLKR